MVLDLAGLDKISIDAEATASLKIPNQRKFPLVARWVISVVAFGFLPQHFWKVITTY